MKSRVTYSSVYVGYIFQHGIQVIICQDTSLIEVEKWCANYVMDNPNDKIYIDATFTKHSTRLFYKPQK